MKTKSLFIILAALLTGMKAMAAVGDTWTMNDSYNKYSVRYKVTDETNKTACVNLFSPKSGFSTGTKVIISDQVTINGNEYTVTAIETEAFKDKTLTTLQLPTTLTTIETYAFSQSKLTTIIIPANVTTIGDFAFYRCTDLARVYWYLADDNSMTMSATQNWFQGCNKLNLIYLLGTKWADKTNWPTSPSYGGTVYYHVAPSITSLASNVSGEYKYLRNYSVNIGGTIYGGVKTDYAISGQWIEPYKQDNGAFDRDYLWMSAANSNVLGVNNNNGCHYFWGKQAGSTTVTVKYHGVTLDTAVPVTVNENECQGITLNETSVTLKLGGTFTLETTEVKAKHGVDYTGNNWVSNNSSVASVHYSNGKVTAKAPGTATITYTAQYLSGPNTATCTVTVLESDISNLKLNGGDATLRVNMDTAPYNSSSLQYFTINPTFDCEDGVDKTKVGLNWTSDNTEVATLGSATSKGENVMSVFIGQPGTANITCSHTNSNGTEVKTTIKVTVYRPDISGFTFGESTYQVVKGNTKNTSVSFTSAEAPENVKITYSVADKTIATFADGVLTGVKNGTTTITASHVQNDGTTVTATADIVVADFFINEFKLSPSSSIMSPGQTVTLEPQATGAGDHTLTYKWETSNENVATVDNTGKVTAVNYGSALITATINQTGQTATCRVTVSKPGLIYAGNIFYKMSADGTSLEVTNCAGGVPSDLTADCYEYAGTVFIPETVTHEGTPYAVSAISPFAFYNQVDLQVLSIPVSVKVIDASACEGAKNLARVFFDSKDGGLLRINDRAFYGCKKLNDIDLPNTTTGIYKQAFQDCDALADIVLSTSLTYIDEQAFADCKVLNNLTLPDTKLNINIAAFQNDKALTSITLPALLQGLGASAFEGCTALDEVTFLTAKGHRFTVGVDAFLGTALTKVKIANLDSWIQINFSNPTANPASIAHHIYNMDGEEIINAVVPEGPIAMNNNVFYGCSALKSITLPATLKTVNDNTLNGCTALEHVYVRAAIPPYFAGTDDPTLMSSVFNAAQLDVPAGKNSQYAADGWWGRFKTISGSLTDAQCATPTIAYTGGKLVFNCATAGVTYLYNVAVADAQGGSGNNAAMSTVYTVTVKATKAGMADSDVVTKDINVGGSGGGIKGDINGDGQVTAGDASQILQYVAGKISW